jgi:hypothetical protein
MDEVKREFRYRGDLYMLVVGPLFCGLMAGLAIYFALTNEGPVWFGNLGEIPRPFVLVTAWVLAALFTALCAGLTVVSVQALTCRQRIAFTEKALLVPKRFWSSGDRAIPYEDIVKLTLQDDPILLPGHRALFVYHGDEKYPIAENFLASPEDFAEVRRLLEARTALACGEEPRPAGLKRLR